MSLKTITNNLGFQQITSLSSSTGLTLPTVPLGIMPKMAVIHCESQAVRWRDDGTAPTASVGMQLPVGGELIYDGDLNAIRFIEEVASAKLNVSFYA